MSQRRLRDELRDVFDDLSEPAHPALSARVRERLESGRQPPSRTPRLATAVAVLAAVVVVASLVFLGRHGVPTPAARPSPVPSVAATAPAPASPTPVASPGSASPVPSPTGGAVLPGFSCAAQSGGAGGGATQPGVTAVRAGPQSGYDRFVLQFDGPVPKYEVRPQAGATFVQDASGIPVTVAGSAGLLVTIDGATGYRPSTGLADVRAGGTAVLREARQVGDFEGVVRWGLGLSRASCFRVSTLTGPSRLVVDVQG